MVHQEDVGENLNDIIQSKFSPSNSVLFYVILPVIYFLPAATMGLSNGTSYSIGTVLVSFLIFGLLSSYISYNISDPILKHLFALTIGISIHSLFCLFLTNLNTTRLLGSLIILFSFFFISYSVSVLVSKFRPTYRNFSFLLFTLISLPAILSLLKLYPSSYQTYNIPFFPFTEPSHYALTIAPLATFLVTSENKYIKAATLLLLFSVLYFIPNTTLAIVLILCILLFFPRKYFLYCLATIFIIFLTASSLPQSRHFHERINFLSGSETKNLSSLVWLQGWQEAQIAILKTKGLGLGFNQLGVTEPSSTAALAIFELNGEYLNRYDGGTLGSKIIAEFGVFGIVLTLFLVKRAICSFRLLTSSSLSSLDSTSRLFYTTQFCIILELFIRGTSYFSPTILLFTISYLSIKLRHAKQSIYKAKHIRNHRNHQINA